LMELGRMNQDKRGSLGGSHKSKAINVLTLVALWT
jgi:hypothetical protein